MRELLDHKANPLNDALSVYALDGPGPGNASHVYEVTVAPGFAALDTVLHQIRFQNGPVREARINGLSQEVLLAIVIDRLRGFQSGPYACRENALALTKLEEAMHWLHHRTRAREQRGVEGTSTV